MPLPTINDVQLVEPILTNLLVGYQQADVRFVAMRVFPNVPVDKDSGTYFKIVKKRWLTDELKLRAPGSTFEQGGYTFESDTYKTLQYALEYPIPVEVRANSQVPMDLEQVGMQWLASQSNIRKERDFATAVFGASAWDNTVTGTTNFTKWSDFAGSDPVKDIRTGRRTISQSIGQAPNVLVAGEIVYDTLVNHPDLLDRLKYNEVATEANIANALAAIFGLERFEVAKGIYNSANTGASGTYSAIIDDDALICYAAPGNVNMMTPTAGKCFSWGPGGGIGSADMYFANDRKSDIIQHSEQWDFKVVSSDAGYELADCVD